MDPKAKITKDSVPEDFSLSLALVDAFPVLFFGGSIILISLLFHNMLFFTGAVLCFWAGAAKVIWKILVVTKQKNIWWLFLQMRIVMPAGFFLMLLSVLLNLSKINLPAIWKTVTSFPSVIFFVLGIFGMISMGVFTAKLDSGNVRANWIEQLTNAVSQFFFFIGILLLF